MASFTGIARGEAGAATALELEAYPGFTEAEIGKIAEPATRALRPATTSLIVHRVGRDRARRGRSSSWPPPPRHRREAFEACDFLMDYLKSRAPFWKKEHGPDGARWIEPTARDHADLARWDEGDLDDHERRLDPRRPDRREPAARRRCAIAVLTISDTRDEESDTSGHVLAERVTGAGHELAGKAIVPRRSSSHPRPGEGLDRARATSTRSSPPAAPASPAAT